MQQSITEEFRYHLIYGIQAKDGTLICQKVARHTNDLSWAIEGLKPAAQKFKNGMAVVYDSYEDTVIERYIHLDS